MVPGALAARLATKPAIEVLPRPATAPTPAARPPRSRENAAVNISPVIRPCRPATSTPGKTARTWTDGPRAFRIGQHRNVLVHKFVTSGTIEEKIELMLAEKRQLADELIDGDGEVGLTELPDDELLDLVRLDVTRAAP